MVSQVLLEICVDSPAAVLAAATGGATRVEVCSNLQEGGVTPSSGLIRFARANFLGKLFVLVRPRGGDFVYNKDEEQVMLADIDAAATLQCDGVVAGCLTTDGNVDCALTGRLMQRARTQDLDFTFHRAIDMCCDISAALEQLVALGVPRVLTSGGAPSAAEGAAVLAQLVSGAAGRITIMAGGGVTEENAQWLVRETRVTELHSSARRPVTSATQYRRPGMTLCSSAPPRDYHWGCTDAARVAAIREQL